MLKRHVLHEFGHALGCIHEHTSPGAHIPWDRPAVYAYYKKKHNGNYSKARVDKNIFKHYDRTLTQFSKFDPHSIMIYPIPKQLTTTGFSVPWNLELSSTDKKFIGTVYPFPKKPRKKSSGHTSGQKPKQKKGQGNGHCSGKQGHERRHTSGHQGQASGSCGQRTSNICGNPACGITFICDADYNRQVQPSGYPGVRRGNPPTGNVCGNPSSGNICGNPNCGKTFICDADYNRQVQPLGYPGVRRC